MCRQISTNLKIFTFLSLFAFLSVKGQNNAVEKVIVDAESLSPIENVNIFNDTDNTVSNIDGKFIFISNNTNRTLR